MPFPISITFGEFRIDLEGQRLWRGLDQIDITPKPFSVLAYLSQRPGRLVTFEELANGVWGDVSVSSATVRSTLRATRRALGDDVGSPRFIETVQARGYRFIAPTIARDVEDRDLDVRPGHLLGRIGELSALRDAFSDAQRGRRRILFISGEPGIGKTMLTEEFLRSLYESGEAAVAHGRCVSGYGQTEPYLPILEALGRICRGRGGRRAQDILERYAPTWMLEIPELLDAEARRRLRVGAMRVGRERMLHELAASVEALCGDDPLVLLLEDLQWSDAASLSAIELLARRQEPAKLLLLVTHRPIPEEPQESSPSEDEHLRTVLAELELHGLCTRMPLPLLTRADIEDYVTRRFPGVERIDPLSDFLWARSEGNPLLFVVHADTLERDGRISRDGSSWHVEPNLGGIEIPARLRYLVDYQLGRLSIDDQSLLEGASACGTEFSPELLGEDAGPGELAGDRLHRLARSGQVVRTAGPRMAFVHDIYREVLYDRLSPVRRERLHRSIGERLERQHPAGTAEIAPELAMHFERGGDAARAIRYLRVTARLALQRSAHEEAETLLRRASGLIESLPVGPERTRAEFATAAQLGNALSLTKGYVAPEVRAAYERAVALADDIDDDSEELLTALAGLHGFYELRSEHDRSAKIALRQIQVAERSGRTYDRLVASLCRGSSCFSVGSYGEAARQLTICKQAYDRRLHSPAAMNVTTDHGANCLGYGSLVFAARGELHEARDWSEQSIALSRDLGHVPSLSLSLYSAMILEQLLQHVDRAHRHASECLELSTKHGFPYFVPAALVVSGWVRARRGEPVEGAAQARQGFAIVKDVGARLAQPIWASMLAEACCVAGEVEAGLEVVDEGLRFVDETGEVCAEPSLHWMRGELLRARSPRPTPSEGAEIEASLARGVEVALGLGAPVQALGPAIRLARIYLESGRAERAKSLLESTVHPVRAAPDVPLLEEAAALLARL